MNEVIFYDSGIGGISLLNETRQLCKRENFIYYADNANLPYGRKSKDEISDLVVSNLEKEIQTTTKCVVVACNTITTIAMDKIRGAFPETKIFGIEPEINSALSPKIKSALLIATPQTCESAKHKIVNRGLSDKITVHPAPTLAKIIERNIANKEVIYREIKKIKSAHKQKFQALILGCTHYALVKDVFSYVFSEEIKIFDGTKGTARNISRTIQKEKKGFGSLKLVLSKDDINEKLKYASLIV